MTFAAGIFLPGISDVLRVLKDDSLQGGPCFAPFLLLRKNGVAQVTVFAQDSAVRRSMAFVVTAKTSEAVHVSDMMGKLAPGYRHFRKVISLIDVLQFDNRLFDFLGPYRWKRSRCG